MAAGTPTIRLDPHPGRPVYLQIAHALMAEIHRGRFQPGDALPGYRTLAAELGVSRNTVLTAYRELAAEGWILAAQGEGSTVAPAPPTRLPGPATPEPAAAPRPTAGFDLRPGTTPGPADAARSLLRVATGNPDPRLLPGAALARAYRRALTVNPRGTLAVDDPQGHPALREALAAHLRAGRGVAAAPGQLVVTRGGQLPLALVAQALLAPGEAVAVEALGPRDAWDAIARAGARCLAVPVDGDGLDLDALERLAQGERLRAVLVSPVRQYPTTATLAPARRARLLSLAARLRIAVLETDHDAEFQYDGGAPLPLAAEDRAGVVILVGSLSKIFSPGLRLGYVLAPAALVPELRAARDVLDRHGDPVLERAMAELLEEGEIARHLNRMHPIYRHRRDALSTALARHAGHALAFAPPTGGLALWARVREGVDVDAWTRRALERGVSFHAGRQFAFDGRPVQALRIGFSGHAEEELAEVARRMGGDRPGGRVMQLEPLDRRLELRGLLGAGGMGQVHRAFDTVLERAVAVKFLRGDDPRETERLVLEARLQARVEHENVVRVLAVGTHGGRPCIVLQLVEGRTLADLAPALTLAEKVELVRQAALGVDAAHRQGLVHRDVKPGNVLVEDGPGPRSARLGDFGLARGEEGGLTRTGLLAGTLPFMAPEQLSGAGVVDFRADVYGLGATLYALLAGHPPFGEPPGGAAPDAASLLRRVLDDHPPPLGPGVPRELARIAAHALEKEASARYGSALALAEDLARFQRGEPILARPPSRLERAIKWARRNPAAARALLAALVAVLAGAGWAALVQRRAGLEALEAARLGAEAQRMENALRLAHLQPAHRLAPTYAAIARAVEALRAVRGGVGAAPRAFAVGRGLQLLRREEEARAALEEGWALGYRPPEAALALGVLDAERYARELAQLPRIDDAARKAALVAGLRARFGEPALARLRLVPAATAGDRALLDARIALVERRWAEAAARARLAAGAGADPLDAGLLEGEALLGQGQEAFERRDIPGSLAAMEAATSPLRRAAGIGRSAPRPRLLLARALQGVDTAREELESGVKSRFEEALAVAQEALALDPDDPELLLARSEIQADVGRVARRVGRDPGPPLADAVRMADAATRAAPGSRRAWDRLAWACSNYARELRDVGYQVDWALDKGIAAARRGQALEPGSSVPPSLLSQLHADRAEAAAVRRQDGRADVEAALAAARRVVEIGDRPVVSRVLLAQALRQDATARAARGEPSSAPFEEAGRIMAEALAISKGQTDLAAHGVYLVSLWAEVELLEGRPPRRPVEVGGAWISALQARAERDDVAAGQLGELDVILAGGAVLEGRDPSPELARAVPRLDRTIRAGIFPAIHARRGEAELVRAAWLDRRGQDLRPALAEALRQAGLMKAVEPASPDGWRLETEALLAAPSPTPAELRRARASIERALQLTPADPRLHALDGLVLLASGDRAGAGAALARAAAGNGRLARVAELRERLSAPPAPPAPSPSR
ncbi:MAG: aminotransferase class I/II-fold pyridoxal phosphate-dependent enzyme [Anaeromyxobacter sp.]